MPYCANCKASCMDNDRHYERFYLSSHSTIGDIDDSGDFLCSPTCLCEFAWRIREAQTKLSKSQVRSHDDAEVR